MNIKTLNKRLPNGAIAEKDANGCVRAKIPHLDTYISLRWCVVSSNNGQVFSRNHDGVVAYIDLTVDTKMEMGTLKKDPFFNGDEGINRYKYIDTLKVIGNTKAEAISAAKKVAKENQLYELLIEYVGNFG